MTSGPETFLLLEFLNRPRRGRLAIEDFFDSFADEREGNEGDVGEGFRRKSESDSTLWVTRTRAIDILFGFSTFSLTSPPTPELPRDHRPFFDPILCRRASFPSSLELKSIPFLLFASVSSCPSGSRTKLSAERSHSKSREARREDEVGEEAEEEEEEVSGLTEGGRDRWRDSVRERRDCCCWRAK